MPSDIPLFEILTQNVSLARDARKRLALIISDKLQRPNRILTQLKQDSTMEATIRSEHRIEQSVLSKEGAATIASM
jgi:hypothetical protein